ncbi:MAG: sulfite exporter TauE/SafE family protein [Clostridia bacterium]|nr:sulfite exporter TauE/SafE family protein [Clostridia bacterium]
MSEKNTVWHVQGMHCIHCEDSVKRALSGLPGLSNIQVSYRRGTVRASWDEAKLPLSAIKAALEREGYALAPEGVSARGRAFLRPLLFILAALALYLLAGHLGLSRWLSAFPLAQAGMGYGALFLLGLTTSLHCVAMCGGIGMAQSAQAAKGGRSVLRANLLYNIGRVASYTLTGGLVGALGTVLNLSDRAKAIVQLVAACFMIIIALNLVGDFSPLRRLSVSLPKGLYARFAGKSQSSLALGLANGFMPCGPLQSMQLYALSTGSAVSGALSMFAFSIGTVPLMLLIGLLAGRMRKSTASVMRTASALIVFIMGFNMLAQGLALTGISIAPTAASAQPDDIAQVSGGVQTVHSELDYGCYPAITVQVGIPVEWTLTVSQEKLNGCNNEIVIPAYNLRVKLAVGDNLISFTPESTGTIVYSCWMGMIRSTITVVEDISDTSISEEPEVLGPFPSPAVYLPSCCQ